MIRDLIAIILLVSAITGISLLMDRGPTRCYAIANALELGCG